MKYLKIKNKGELDVRLISLMGGTTKAGDSYKIGRFGTGLKYSLAYLIRNNIDFKIFVGEKQVEIGTNEEEIQGTKFNVIYINGERSSITSNMGVDWEGWMIVRELWCNAIDEGDNVKETTEEIIGNVGCTTFYIQLIGEIKQTVDNWKKYFIHEIKPIYETEFFGIYPASEKMRIYKNGVLIHEDDNYKSVFSYDIKNAHINELREYKGYKTLDLFDIIKNLNKECAEIFISSIHDKCFEHGMDYSWHGEFSSEWGEAIGQAKIIAKEDLDILKKKGVKIDEEKLIAIPKSLFNKLSTRFPGISAVRRSEKVSAFYESFDSELELKIKQALAILESCGYEINPELKFIYGVFGDQNVFAQVNMDEKIVMFSSELKRKSLFNIITCIVEENEHFLTGFCDESRSFQQHFINLYVKQMLDKNEVLI